MFSLEKVGPESQISALTPLLFLVFDHRVFHSVSFFFILLKRLQAQLFQVKQLNHGLNRSQFSAMIRLTLLYYAYDGVYRRRLQAW